MPVLRLRPRLRSLACRAAFPDWKYFFWASLCLIDLDLPVEFGGIGAIAPSRRQDLARLGLRALFVGFLATLLNAAIAGVFLQ